MTNKTNHSHVFLLDVDNTLLDNDRLKDELTAGIVERLGTKLAARYWELYEDVRSEFAFVDVYEALGRLNAEFPDYPVHQVIAYIENFPYESTVFPGSLPAIAQMQARGLPVIVSDGETVFQGRKIVNSGLAKAVRGNVLVYLHKEDHIDEIIAKYPADHYWFIDDKARLLGKLKARLGDRITTVHVQFGKYAGDCQDTGDPCPDCEIGGIGDFVELLPPT